jgi:hypothetical protein
MDKWTNGQWTKEFKDGKGLKMIKMSKRLKKLRVKN